MATKAASSELNTLALPLNFVSLRSAIFMTAPSGAKEPVRIFRVPSVLSGSSTVLTILRYHLEGLNNDIFSLIVSPVTVNVLPLRTPKLSNLRMTCIPPILSKSAIAFPPGRISAICGVCFLILSKSLI